MCLQRAPEVCAINSPRSPTRVDPAGRLYVLQFLRARVPGQHRRCPVDTCGSAPVDLQTGLSHPTGLVIGVDGAAYVTNKTLAPTGTGEVLRIPLD